MHFACVACSQSERCNACNVNCRYVFIDKSLHDGNGITADKAKSIQTKLINYEQLVQHLKERLSYQQSLLRRAKDELMKMQSLQR